MGNEIPKILYHYCSIENFYNIIVNKTLWLTDSFSTNDYIPRRFLGSHKGDPTKIIGAISDCKFRVTPNDIAPYFLLPFSEQKSISPIAEIILGPKNQMEMYKIRTFLSMNDLNGIDIKYSMSSYR